jgi:amidase
MTDDLSRLDATAQAELVRRGDVTPVELVEAAIDRAERVDGDINAIVHQRFDEALQEAKGEVPDAPLRGVPFVVKDLDGFSAGDPYHGGMRHLRDVRYVPAEDSHLTRRLREAGLVVIGRTNTPELGLQPTTEPALYGPSRNPWDLTRSTGGSSGGSAAAVAAGVVPMGHAGDGGGSIRIPASACGLVGLKPSRGRVSLGPEVGEAWGGAVARLVVSRTVRDTALVLDLVHGTMPGDPYTAPPPTRPYVDELTGPDRPLRIGFTAVAPDPAVATHPACVAAVDEAARRLSDLGHHVEEARPDAWDDAALQEQVVGAFVAALGAWAAADLEALGRRCGVPIGADGVEPGTWAIVEMGRGVTAVQYLEAAAVLHRYGRLLAEWWAGGFDLLLTPTLPEPPPTLGQFRSVTDDPFHGLARGASIVPFCAPFNMSGQPAISVPVHHADGLPIGVQLVGAYGREDHLVAVASQLEAAVGWVDRVPPVHA